MIDSLNRHIVAQTCSILKIKVTSLLCCVLLFEIFLISAFTTCGNGIEVIEETDFNNGVFDCSDNSDEPVELCKCSYEKIRFAFEKRGFFFLFLLL